MICKVCGHEDDKYFSICPYCGEETSSENENFDEFDKGDLNAENINKISESEELHVQRYISKVDVSHYNTPVINDLPIEEPRGFIKTVDGFIITRKIDNGDFYHKHLLFYILALILFFMTNSHGNFFTMFFIYFIIGSFLNSIYDKFMNNFTFEVNPNGVYVISPMIQYFIPRGNIKQFWFSRKMKVTNYHIIFELLEVFSSQMYVSGRGGMNYVSLADTQVFDASSHVPLYKIFFEVDNPIFKDEKFASMDRRIKRFINTGLTFKNPAHARFMEREFERVLCIEDELVEDEFDYDAKVKKIVNAKLRGVR